MTNLEQLAERLDPIINRQGFVWPDTQEKTYRYHRYKDEERHNIDTTAVVDYWQQHNPARIYDLEKLVGKHERTLEKVKRKVENGQLEGKVVDDVFIPEGDPGKLYQEDTDCARWGMCSYPFIAIPWGVASLVDSWARKTKSPVAHKVNEVVQRCYVPFHFAGMALGLPIAILVSLGLAIGTFPNASQRAYGKLDSYQQRIFSLVPDEELERERRNRREKRRKQE